MTHSQSVLARDDAVDCKASERIGGCGSHCTVDNDSGVAKVSSPDTVDCNSSNCTEFRFCRRGLSEAEARGNAQRAGGSESCEM